MLGTRGCRLGIIKPGLYRMQVRALMQAAVTRKQAGGNPIVEIMIPLIVSEPELKLLEEWTREEADTVLRDAECRGRLSRRHDDRDAARRARRRRDRRRRRVLLVRHQRPHADDVRVLPRRHRGPVHERVPRATSCSPANPFETLDVEGVGQLVRMGVREGPRDRVPDIKLGICGEHGGDPASVAFCHEVGLDYVSCSPYRVPIARLAAAHAAVGAGGPGTHRLRCPTPRRSTRLSGEIAAFLDEVFPGAMDRFVIEEVAAHARPRAHAVQRVRGCGRAGRSAGRR